MQFRLSFSQWVRLGSFSVLLLTAFFTWQLPKLRFDSDFEHFFPRNSESAERYAKHKEWFGYEDGLMLVLETNDNIFTQNNLSKIDSLSRRLKSMEALKQVLSVTTAEKVEINEWGVARYPWLRWDTDSMLNATSHDFTQAGIFSKTLYSEDHKSACILVQPPHLVDEQARSEFLNKLENIRQESGFAQSFWAGKMLNEQVYLEKTRYELVLFAGMAIVLVIVYLAITFQTLLGVLLPLVVVLLAALWTLGLMALMGKPIDLMVNLMPCILFVVGSSDVIHLLTQYQEKCNEGFAYEAALLQTMKEVGRATLLTCITTMLAFFTLTYTSQVPPVQEFGFYTALGVGFAFILSIVLLPAMVLQIKHKPLVKMKRTEQFWQTRLNDLSKFIARRAKPVLALFVLITAIALAGGSRIRINNHILQDLNPKHPLRQQMQTIDEQFGGLRIMELQLVFPKNKDALATEHLVLLEKIEHYLQRDYDASSVLSPLVWLRGVHMALNDGNHAFLNIPKQPDETEALVKKAQQVTPASIKKQTLQSKENIVRISARLKDKGSAHYLKASEQLADSLSHWCAPLKTQWYITGAAQLIDENNQTLTRSLLVGIAINVLVMMLILALMFKSWKMMLAGIVPNIFPLLVLCAWMGYASIELTVSVSIIFTIAFGIAVDDTLHFVSRIKVELNKGQSMTEALTIALKSTGKAMIITTLVICSGFITLSFSDFQSTALIGRLLSITLITALVADLVLLPALIRVSQAYKPKSH